VRPAAPSAQKQRPPASAGGLLLFARGGTRQAGQSHLKFEQEMKGPGFSLYINSAKSVGLQPLRDSHCVDWSSVSAGAWCRFHQNYKLALVRSLPSGTKTPSFQQINVRAEARTLQRFKCDCLDAPGLIQFRTSAPVLALNWKNFSRRAGEFLMRPESFGGHPYPAS
jgi:hypothetical protein